MGHGEARREELCALDAGPVVGHHIVHRGYDTVNGVSRRLTSSVFAKGWRRWWDCADWLDPEAWRHEHNTLHHYKLGEVHGPDQPEHNVASLRWSKLPSFVRVAIVALVACVWKFAYYAPNTVRTKENHARQREDGFEPVPFPSLAMWAPWTRPGRSTWWRCYLPYVLLHFVLLWGGRSPCKTQGWSLRSTRISAAVWTGVPTGGYSNWFTM